MQLQIENEAIRKTKTKQNLKIYIKIINYKEKKTWKIFYSKIEMKQIIWNQ